MIRINWIEMINVIIILRINTLIAIRISRMNYVISGIRIN